MARFLSALGLSLVALVCRQTLPTLLVIHLGYAVTDYGNQGTTVDHGSVLLGTSLSGGGVYVGATRGRDDNTIHIVADDLEGAKAQFITTLTRDRADRRLDQARADLAAQLPQHTLAVHPRIRRYIDNVSQRLTRVENEMRRLQPLAEQRAKAQAFQQRHETTAAQAWDEAERAQQTATDKAAELKSAREQLHRQDLKQLRSDITREVSGLQAKEQRVRDAGFLTRIKAKHDARTTRAALEYRYGVALPGTDDERFKHPCEATITNGSTMSLSSKPKPINLRVKQWNNCTKRSNNSAARRAKQPNELSL